uniref:Uncharacterized protein n=1 Tax=Gopherus agassizii TaxID=38772 RepID=A0A452ID09_9SAUR
MDFTHLQLSGFMAILNFLLENLSTKRITLEGNIKELGRAMAGIGESHSEKSGGLDFFSVDQAKAIISYLKISLFQHYKLYEYLFYKPREELVIGDESLRKRINGHKSDIRNGNIQKPVGEHFNLPGHTIADLKVAILQQKNFRTRLQRETAELQFICKFDTISSGLNKDCEWLANYRTSFSSLGFHTSTARTGPHPP